jgi:hypothetical protein
VKGGFAALRILLGNVVERQFGAFGTDIDPAAAAEDERIDEWANAVRVEREGA